MKGQKHIYVDFKITFNSGNYHLILVDLTEEAYNCSNSLSILSPHTTNHCSLTQALVLSMETMPLHFQKTVTILKWNRGVLTFSSIKTKQNYFTHPFFQYNYHIILNTYIKNVWKTFNSIWNPNIQRKQTSVHFYFYLKKLTDKTSLEI